MKKDLAGWVGPMELLSSFDTLVKADINLWCDMLEHNLKGVSVSFDSQGYRLTVNRGNCDAIAFNDGCISLEKVKCAGNDNEHLVVERSDDSIILDFSGVEVLYYNGKYIGDRVFSIDDLGDVNVVHLLDYIIASYLKSLGIRPDTKYVKRQDTGSYYRYRFNCDTPEVASVIAKGFYGFMSEAYSSNGNFPYIKNVEFLGAIKRLSRNNFDAVFGECFNNYWLRFGSTFVVTMEVFYA